MHRFDADDSLSEVMDRIDGLYEDMEKKIDAIKSEADKKTFDEIADTIYGDKPTEYEDGFFEKSAKELGKYFGKTISEPVRAALLATWMWNAAEDDADELVDEMSGEEK